MFATPRRIRSFTDNDSVGNTTSVAITPALTAGHTFRWNMRASNSAGFGGYSGNLYFQTQGSSLPATPSSPTPADNSTPASQPTLFDWADSANATSYDVYLNGGFKANVTASQWTPDVNFAIGDQQSWYVIAKNASGNTTGPTWHFTVSTTQGNNVVAGFDREFFPAHADTMADLFQRTNLRWCGYYLSGPSQRLYTGWLGERSYLQNLGWKLAPLYVGQQEASYNGGNLSYNPSSAQGTSDGNEAVAEMGPDTGSVQTVYQYNSSTGKYDIPVSVPKGQGFASGTAVFLDWESATLTVGNDSDYVVNWCRAVSAGGYTPGVYCHPSEIATINSQLSPYGISAQFWVANWTNQPAVPSNTTQFLNTDPASGGTGATTWQYGSGYNIDTINGLLPNVDLNTSSLFGTSTGMLPANPSSPSPADNSTPASQPTLFDWADSANATNYDVYLNGGFKANVTASHWTPDVNFAIGDQQSWYVIAKNVSGSTTGPTWHFTVGSTNLPAPAPSTPANSQTNVSTTPSFSWSSVTGATSYRIVVATNASDLPTDPTSDGSGASIVLNQTPSTNSFTPSTPLAAGTTYYWKVKARNATQYGDWSITYSFTTQPAVVVPGTPSNPSPLDNATLTAQPTLLDWADSANATSYDLYLNGAYQANVTASQWTPITSFTTNVVQTWQVIARNSAGTTAGSTWHFTVQSPNCCAEHTVQQLAGWRGRERHAHPDIASQRV